MTSRRGFLNILASAPVAAPIAAKEAINQAAEGIGMAGVSGAAGNCVGVAIPDDTEGDLIWEAIRKMIDDEDAKVFRGGDPIPASIASKKSWSAVFKESEAHKFHVARRRLSNAIQRAAYNNDPYHVRAAKLMALGLKVKL